MRRETVFNLLLERGAPSGVVKVGGRLACVLGHELNGEGGAHPFFGSYDAVEASLKGSGTWGLGVVELEGATRDEGTGLVSGFVVTSVPVADREAPLTPAAPSTMALPVGLAPIQMHMAVLV